MKTYSFIFCSLFLSLLGAGTGNLTAAPATTPPNQSGQKPLPEPTAYHVIQRTANSRVWQRETYERGPTGEIITRTHKYTEVATGLHYKDARGNWVDSKELIEPYANGAIARQGPYQVIFANNLNSAGAIDLQASDGERLRSNILGLGYFDRSTGTSVLISAIQDSQGQLIADNQVLYPNAFQGINADVRYTYKKGSFEQDVVLREQPPTPESYGLNPETTELEVLTEFINPPAETIKEQGGATDSGTDQEISWGATRLGHGKAFDLGDEKDLRHRVNVHRQYTTVDGRKILLEKVPMKNVQNSLKGLPPHAALKSKVKTASRSLALPHPRLAQAIGQPMRVAVSSPPGQGYVLDYVELTSGETDFTFQADTTYYISDYCYLSGAVTIEGGAVIKYNYNGQLGVVDGPINCETGPYRVAVFTSMNDNSIGESIDGSSGAPSFDDASLMFDVLTTSTLAFNGLRFSYAFCALYNEMSDGYWEFTDCQFIKDSCSIFSYNVTLHNVLIGASTGSPDGFPSVYAEGTNFEAEHLTADQGYGLLEMDYYLTNYISLTNCLVTGQPLIVYASHGVLSTNSTIWLPSVVSPVYQTVGAASYYLTNNSPYRNAGTTNISPTLLADLATKTTYPPLVYSNLTISGGVFAPQAQRDTDAPDLGYHYDPLDYCFSGVHSSSNIIFTAGTAMAWFELIGSGGPGYGIALPDATSVSYEGTLAFPCAQVRYNTVQECGNGNWVTKGWLGAIAANGDTDDPSQCSILNARFTLFAGFPSEGGAGRDYTSVISYRFTDCMINSSGAGGYADLLYFTNCLLLRPSIGAMAEGTIYSAVSLHNCTMRGGTITAWHWGGYWPVYIEDCAFEGTDFGNMDDPSGGDPSIIYADYNAFLSGAGQPPESGAHDKTVTSFNWQTSWLGNFYLPANSSLINAGRITADQIGLYHFTTQTNQVKETNSVVDIGYHYVAVDASGIPFDTNGDGIPDYLEDANGNGLVNSGEIGWNIFGDLGLKVFITRPRYNSTLP